MLKLSARGHEVELVQHREIIDLDGTAFHQFTFAVDGRLCLPWEIPKQHRSLYRNDAEFEEYLARSAVTFSESTYNQPGRN